MKLYSHALASLLDNISGFLVLRLNNLRRSRLGLENLNNLIIIYKNWPSDSRTDCKLYEHLADFYSRKAAILEENEDEFAQEGFLEEVNDE